MTGPQPPKALPPIPAGPARDALEAIREALDIPYAATVGDEEIRAKILDHRLGHAVAMLRGVLAEDIAADVPWSVAYLRAQLAKHPAEGYKTWDERMAELGAAREKGSASGAGRAAPRTYTHPDVFTLGVEQGWAEAETDPTRIDWPTRQAAAAIPFKVVDGRPVNPCAVTGVRYGRNEMGYWGETAMADALVTVTYLGIRYLLMVERGDGYGWAVPGGHVEPGETGLHAAVRELAEETGLALFGQDNPRMLETFHEMAPRYVPDPRASDEAWAVTVPVHVDLGQLAGLPFVAGGDDARRADWIRADTYEHLMASLSERYGGRVFAAHTDMLREFLGGAS